MKKHVKKVQATKSVCRNPNDGPLWETLPNKGLNAIRNSTEKAGRSRSELVPKSGSNPVW
jgi:hypothetical protein